MKVILQVRVDDDDPMYKSMDLPIVTKGLVIDGLFEDMDTWKIIRLWYRPKLNIVIAELDMYAWAGSVTISQEMLDRWALAARESWFETPEEVMSKQAKSILDMSLGATELSIRSKKALRRWVDGQNPNLRSVSRDLTVGEIVGIGKPVDVMIDELLEQREFGPTSKQEVVEFFQRVAETGAVDIGRNSEMIN